MRATPSTMRLTVAAGLQRAMGRMEWAQAQLASGRRISRWSDAPTDASAALRLRAAEHDWAAFARAADDGKAWLSTQDQALQSASSVLRRVRELAVAGASSILVPGERAGLAAEVDALRDQMASLANTTHLGRSAFGGFAGAAVAGGPGAWAFVGDGGAVARRVAPDAVVQVNLDGREVFGFDGPPGTDMLSVLDGVAGHLRTGDIAALGADLDAIDTRARAVTTGLAVVGGRQNMIEAARAAGDAQVEALRASRSQLEDADLAEAVMELQLAENAYQAVLGATARLSMPSLVDFLR